LLITPERFLKRANIDGERSLALLVYKKLQVELDPKSATYDNYLEFGTPNLFVLSFVDQSAANKTYIEVEKRVEAALPDLGISTSSEQEFRLLPPLFLLSEDRFITCFDDVLLIASPQGPIIPVVQLQRIREKNILEQLILLYSKNSDHFVNVDTIRDVLVSV